MCAQWIKLEQTDPPKTSEITSCPCGFKGALKDKRFVYDVIASTLKRRGTTCFRTLIPK